MVARRRGHCVLVVGARMSCMVKVGLDVCMFWDFGLFGCLVLGKYL